MILFRIPVTTIHSLHHDHLLEYQERITWWIWWGWNKSMLFWSLRYISNLHCIYLTYSKYVSLFLLSYIDPTNILNVIIFSQWIFICFSFFREELIKNLRAMQPANSRFSPVCSSDVVDHSKIPAELQCPMCKKLFTDVVVTPCCGFSYCDECK